MLPILFLRCLLNLLNISAFFQVCLSCCFSFVLIHIHSYFNAKRNFYRDILLSWKCENVSVTYSPHTSTPISAWKETFIATFSSAGNAKMFPSRTLRTHPLLFQREKKLLSQHSPQLEMWKCFRHVLSAGRYNRLEGMMFYMSFKTSGIGQIINQIFFNGLERYETVRSKSTKVMLV